MIKPPYPAPDFSLPDESNNIRQLSDYRGKWLVLYFYPQDDTPGCTIEACSVRDSKDDIVKLGAEVVGVSRDSTESHEAFKAKYTLNFSLLSDSTMSVIKAYGCWGKKMFGVSGVLRRTFIIDPNGIVRKVYGRVLPDNHGSKILNDLKELMSK